MDNFVITVARGFGSGGKEVASKIAKSLGVFCYEHRILTLASQLTGLDESKFQEVDEKLNTGYVGTILRGLPRSTSFISVNNEFVSDQIIFQYQTEIIKELVKKESCVIVGKCADHILQDHKRKISIYVEASRESCIKRTVQKMGVTPKEANSIVVKNDKYRTKYYKFYTGGKDWRSPLNYDLIINSDFAGIEGCVEIVKEYMTIKFPDIAPMKNR